MQLLTELIRICIDHIVTGTVVADVVAGGEANPFRILAKPSAFLESYFESTKDIVEGVDEVYYSNKIVVREIKDAAKRESGDATTAAANSINFTVWQNWLVHYRIWS